LGAFLFAGAAAGYYCRASQLDHLGGLNSF